MHTKRRTNLKEPGMPSIQNQLELILPDCCHIDLVGQSERKERPLKPGTLAGRFASATCLDIQMTRLRIKRFFNFTFLACLK